MHENVQLFRDPEVSKFDRTRWPSNCTGFQSTTLRENSLWALNKTGKMSTTNPEHSHGLNGRKSNTNGQRRERDRETDRQTDRQREKRERERERERERKRGRNWEREREREREREIERERERIMGWLRCRVSVALGGHDGAWENRDSMSEEVWAAQCSRLPKGNSKSQS